MTTQAGRNARTLAGYVSTLLEYPRWVIARDVDFTNCRHNGAFDQQIEECANCQFGDACQWLDRHRTPVTQEASLGALVSALESAIKYLQPKQHAKRGCRCRNCSWLREARHFLHNRLKPS